MSDEKQAGTGPQKQQMPIDGSLSNPVTFLVIKDGDSDKMLGYALASGELSFGQGEEPFQVPGQGGTLITMESNEEYWYTTSEQWENGNEIGSVVLTFNQVGGDDTKTRDKLSKYAGYGGTLVLTQAVDITWQETGNLPGSYGEGNGRYFEYQPQGAEAIGVYLAHKQDTQTETYIGVANAVWYIDAGNNTNQSLPVSPNLNQVPLTFTQVEVSEVNGKYSTSFADRFNEEYGTP